MKFNPLVPKIESSVAVGRLPEEVNSLTRLIGNTLDVGALKKGGIEDFSVIQMVRRKLEA